MSKFLDETNLTQIEEYLKKHNSLIINKDNKKSFFYYIPLATIIYALLIIFIMRGIIPNNYPDKIKDINNKNDNEEREITNDE